MKIMPAFPFIMVLLAIALLSGCINVREAGREGGEVAISIDFGAAQTDRFNGTGTYNFDGGWTKTVYDALAVFSSAADFSVAETQFSSGRFVQGIAGVNNEGASGMNWQYWVNGQYADRAVDYKTLNGGDDVEFSFAKDPFG
jgi:hypothetical protein